MNSLQKTVDDLRADEKALEALKQNYELQKITDELREICAEGRAGAGTLEELMAPLQKIVDEMRAGDGPLEALKQGILNRRNIKGEGTMVLQEYVVCAGGSTGDGTPKGRRDGIPSIFDGGNGA